MLRALGLVIAMSAGCSFDSSADIGGGDVVVGQADAAGDASTASGDDASSNSDSDGAPATLADAEPAEPAYALQVNLGGNQDYVGTDYPGTWLADDGTYCGGSDWDSVVPIHNTADDPLFQSNRYGTFTCSFGGGQLASGDYIVTLLFGEVYRGAGCVNPGASSRIYDVLMEGVVELNNFDVMEANGGCVASTTTQTPAPVARQFTINVTDGTLTIATQGTTNGMISALRIESVATL